MPDTPRPMTTFRNRVLLSETTGCTKYLSDLKLEDAPTTDPLFRLRHYNQEYSYVGTCQAVPVPDTPTINAVTREFESRVVLTGTALNDVERFAISTFYNNVASFWSKLYEIYPFVGSALNGGLVPLKKTTTTGGVPSANLTNTFYDRNLGILVGGGDAGSRYLGFGATSEDLRLATLGSGYTRVYSVSYSGVATNPLLGNFSAASNSSDFFTVRTSSAPTNNVYADMFSTALNNERCFALNTSNVADNTYIITRGASSVIKVFNEQGLLATSVAAPAERTLAALPLEIGRSRVFGGAITMTALDYRLKFFASGQGLSDAEAATLTAAIKTFKTAVGR